jgi:hypothetical protein
MRICINILIALSIFAVTLFALSEKPLQEITPSRLPPQDALHSVPEPRNNCVTASGFPALGWKTYTNTAYRFILRYPPEWTVFTRGEGEEVEATGKESHIFVSPALYGPETPALLVDIYELGSQSIGRYYQPAKTLDDFITLLVAAQSSSSKSTVSFVKQCTVNKQAAFEFRVCQRAGHDTSLCSTHLYFQNDDNIYVVERRHSNDDTNETISRIISSFSFL